MTRPAEQAGLGLHGQLGRASLGTPVNPATPEEPEGRSEGLEVARRARTHGSKIMAIEGELSESPFCPLLQKLARGRARGALVIKSHGNDRRPTTTGEPPTKIVYFRAGVPVYVQSNLVEECLGHILEREGYITRVELGESARRVLQGKGRQGAILVAMGSITPRELRNGLEIQLRTKILELFGWENGHFSFSEAVHAPPQSLSLEMGLSELVYQGIVHRTPPARLLALLSPHLDAFVVPNGDAKYLFHGTAMPEEARRALTGLTGRQRLRELLAEGGNRPGAVAQIIHALHSLGAATFRQGAPTGTEANASRAPQVAPSMNLAVMREELSRLGRLLRAEQYANAVALEADLSPAQACDRLIERYRPVTEPGSAPRDLRALAHEVCARLVRARRALAHADRAAREEEAVLVAELRRLHRAEFAFAAGRHALDGGHPRESLPLFAEACMLVPTEGEFLAYLGYARCVTAEIDSSESRLALAELRRAQGLAPESAEVHVLMGRVLRSRGDFAEACTAYERAIVANPTNAEAAEGIRTTSWGPRARA